MKWKEQTIILWWKCWDKRSTREVSDFLKFCGKGVRSLIMTSAKNTKQQHLDPEAINTRIDVSNFGPINSGHVELRPLTVLIGPSNTGKSYLAILIYALHRALSGFSKLPSLWEPDIFDEELNKLREEYKGFLEIIKSKRTRIHLSDFPSIVGKSIEEYFNEPGQYSSVLMAELRSCFDTDSLKSLISSLNGTADANITTTTFANGNEIWRSKVSISKSGEIDTEGSIIDFELMNEAEFSPESDSSKMFQIRNNRIEKMDSWDISQLLVSFIEKISPVSKNVFYLPAARSGIMQSHRIIASAVMSQSTRAGLDKFEGSLTFSSMTAEFLSHLIAFDSKHGMRHSWMPYAYRPLNYLTVRHSSRSKSIINLADEIEKSTLGGKVTSKTSKNSGYPEFYYRPDGVQDDIRMNHVSSMVTELSPLVLFIRENICKGDTLIVEEPEAHLHPEAQTKIAVILAKLVRLGVRVVVTTHSDWLLKEFGNLIREGDLAAKSDEYVSTSGSALRAQDVGAWLFQKGEKENGSTVSEIEFDPVEGIEPSDYEDVAERLYNRSVKLQDKLDVLP